MLRRNAHLYVMSDDETAYVMKPVGEAMGFKYWKQIIWGKMTKDGSRLATGMGYHYRGCNERILFFEKGKRKLNSLSMLDVLQHPGIRAQIELAAGGRFIGLCHAAAVDDRRET